MKEKFKIELTKKQIIYLGVFTTIIYGLILYIFNIYDSLQSIALQSIIYGVSMTLFFTFLFPWMMKKMVGKRIDNIEPELIENEKIEEVILANLFKGLEAVGGKIFLTNERLIFNSHSLNVQTGQTNINYSDIISIEKRKTMKIVNNGIKITTKKDKNYCFVVNDREAQIRKIRERIS